MPNFQFTPILTVVTDDDGILRDLDWDWSDSGQGQWDEVRFEHVGTPAHEQVCQAFDAMSTRWLPEGHPTVLEDEIRVHTLRSPIGDLINSIESLAQERQRTADEKARANNPKHPGTVRGHDPAATALKAAANQIRRLCLPREPAVSEPVLHVRSEDNPDGVPEYRCDVRFHWLLDEDELPRVEHGYGPTPEAARAEAEEIGRLVAEDTTGTR